VLYSHDDLHESIPRGSDHVRQVREEDEGTESRVQRAGGAAEEVGGRRGRRLRQDEHAGQVHGGGFPGGVRSVDTRNQSRFRTGMHRASS
jgi:hypothetical protein